jgi:protein AbiQ
MTNQPTVRDFQYVHLNTQFYEDFKGFKEILKDEDRQYLHIVTQYMGNTFLIPFRSEMKHNYGFKFSRTDNKGLDFTKAIIVNDLPKYVVLSQKNIPQYQHNLIVRNAAMIKRKFFRYVDDYCKAVRNNDTNVLRRIGQYSPLQYFHKELGLS